MSATRRKHGNASAALVRDRESVSARRELLGLVIAAQEAERARVSRDLHDEIGQALTSVLLGLHLVEVTPGDEESAATTRSERLADVRALVTDALDRVRSLAFELRPTVLDDIGLVPALERLVSNTEERSGLAVTLTIRGLDQGARLTPEIETVVYRIVQEALTNVVRHAAATVASVLVEDDAGQIAAVVDDDGHGFDPSQYESSIGIGGMRERVELAGGSLSIESSASSGTVVRATVPNG